MYTYKILKTPTMFLTLIMGIWMGLLMIGGQASSNIEDTKKQLLEFQSKCVQLEKDITEQKDQLSKKWYNRCCKKNTESIVRKEKSLTDEPKYQINLSKEDELSIDVSGCKQKCVRV